LAAQTFLEQPRIVAVGNNNAEIHIDFSTDVRYVRHFPERRGDVLRVFLEVVDPCNAEEIKTQETKWLPRADWFVPFTVTFPELIRRSGSGTATCPASRNLVNVSQTLLIKFGKITNFTIRPGNDNHSIVVLVPLLKVPPEVKAPAKAQESKTVLPPNEQERQSSAALDVQPPPPEALPKEQVAIPEVLPMPPEQQAGVALKAETPPPEASQDAQATVSAMTPTELLEAGRAALAAGDGLKATEYFNRLLLIPNEYTQEAQELVGIARQKSGEIAKAEAEYQLYLNLYPDGEGAARVKRRLAALETGRAAPVAEKPKDIAKKQIKQVQQDSFIGSISQYYYGGKTQIKNDTAGDKTKTNTTDQSSLITNVDATGHSRHNQYDTRIVFRNSETHNFLPQIADRNTLSAAYFQHENKDVDYMVRIGRQSPALGLLGRWDGATLRYGLNERWHVTAVAGVPDNGSQNTVETKRHFYGAAVEFGPLAEKWNGSVYVVQQIADGLTERRAIGTELRYFNGTTSWFGMIDYDAIYNMVNFSMLQGNWTTESGYNFNLLLDHRKNPVLYAETAIPAQIGAVRVKDLRVNNSNSEIYKFVEQLTPDGDLADFGVTKQVTDRWQLGGDIRVNLVYATDGTMGDSFPGNAEIPVQPGTGFIYTYTVQATGRNTIFTDDSSSILVSYVNDPTYNGQSVSLSNSVTFRELWRVDSALSYYHQKTNLDQQSWQVSPSVRLSYQFRDNLSFETEYRVNYNRVDDPNSLTKTDTLNQSLFAGYRWDFR
jgi:hypothetical protein